jgi:exonuclease III
MDLSKIIIWNVRGLNKKARRDAVRQTIVSTQPDLVCLQETKKASISRFMVMSLLGSEFDHFICLPALGTRGGILVAWKGDTCKVLQTRVDSFSVFVQVDHISSTPWWFTGVYGPQPDDQKLQFLNELRTIRSACFGPWTIGGDFNLIYRAEDKNNSNLDRAMMGRFCRILNELNLSELPLMGRKFTWSNERASLTLVRLDRVFHTSDWGDYFPDCVLQSSATFISDHCPLLLGLHEYSQGRRLFHFESYWPKLEGFMEKVEESWVQPVGSYCPLQRFAVKLKRLSKHLQSWSQQSVGNVKNQLLAAKEIMHQLEIAGDSRALSPLEERLRRRLKLHSLALSSLERTMARTRSGLRWLKEGEANTSFFHQQARYRKKKNFIAKLKVADRILVEQEEKQEVVWDFYNNLLGTAVQRNCSFNLAAFHIPTRNLEQLERDVTEAEVWATINSIPSDKAPGPDGYTGRFYKHAWPIIKGDFMTTMGRILLGDVSNLHLLNSALVTLLPKKSDAAEIKDFRPISLIHSFAKIVTKLLANRLAPMLPELISPNQSAFVKGRSIQDNFIMMQQTARAIHRQKIPKVLLKLDIGKAFDSVSWPFLLEVLGHLGFGPGWCNIISKLLCSSSTRVLVNGEPGKLICHQRGLRQGDPLSPMLFILVMDVLNSLFSRASEMGLL